MKATIRTSPVSQCWTTADSNPAELNFGRNSLPVSRAAEFLSLPEMAFSFQAVARAGPREADLLHDNHRYRPKSTGRSQGAFFENLSVK
jgi:hypothetical protein